MYSLNAHIYLCATDSLPERQDERLKGVRGIKHLPDSGQVKLGQCAWLINSHKIIDPPMSCILLKKRVGVNM